VRIKRCSERILFQFWGQIFARGFLSGIKEAGAPNEAQQNSKLQQRIPELFPTKSSNFHNKSAIFSFPVFS